MPRHGGVERDDAQAVELVDAIDGAKVRILVVPQLTAERGAIVVVSHHPHHRRLEASGHGFHHRAQRGIGGTFAEIDEVARHHDRVGTHARCFDAGNARARCSSPDTRSQMREPAARRWVSLRWSRTRSGAGCSATRMGAMLQACFVTAR
jgi:hypothetical protein